MHHLLRQLKRSFRPPYTRKKISLFLLLLAVLFIPVLITSVTTPVRIKTKANTQSRVLIPHNNSRRGLIYDGLEPDATGICKGLYKITDRSNRHSITDECTHGPDPFPVGIDANTTTPPVVESGPVLGTSVACSGDGQSNNRVQVVYAHASDVTDRYSQYLTSFQTWAAGVDTIYYQSAMATGNYRHVRFVHDANCVPIVLDVKLPTDGDDDFAYTKSEMANLGYSRTDRKYLIFMDANRYCGIGTIMFDDSNSFNNYNNRGPSYGRVDAPCWRSNVAAHELMHNLGGVQKSAPHSNGGTHCYDAYDRMCYVDETGVQMVYLCTDPALDDRFDCNHDDYYSTNPKPGSYLATHWNAANNSFLMGVTAWNTPTPTPKPTSTPTPKPTNTPTPKPTNTPSPTPKPTNTPTPKPTSTITPTPSPTTFLTPTPTKAPTNTPTPRPTSTPIPTTVPRISPTPTTTVLKGDFNHDGKVDILDFNLWRDEFSGLKTTKLSDGNGDGVVDLLDFNIWLNAFY